jgi:stage II sporulation protein M
MSKSGFKLMIEIFWGNLLICLKSIILGFVPFLFLPVIGVFSSIMPIGLFLAGVNLFTEMDQFSFFVSLLPHGIFELAASLYASSVGVYLTIQTSKMILPKFRAKAVPLRTLCKQAAHSFILIVVPLLMVAAFIEAFISSIPK